MLGIAVSPDDNMLAVRNRHSLELLNAVTGSKVGDSVVVDATPDAEIHRHSHPGSLGRIVVRGFKISQFTANPIN
jgi:hypothetical protein